MQRDRADGARRAVRGLVIVFEIEFEIEIETIRVNALQTGR